MINALKSFYLSEADSTLEQHFIKVADGKLLKDGSLSVRDMSDESDLKLYYEIPASDSIVIYASSVVMILNLKTEVVKKVVTKHVQL